MFCTGCGAALPAGAKFCPKCGAAAPGEEAVPPAPAPPPSPPTGTSAGTPAALDLTQPKVQAEAACVVSGAILALLGFIGLVQGGSILLVAIVSLADIAIGGYAIWAFQLSRQGKLVQAQQAAGVAGLSVIVLGVVGLALSRGMGGGAFVIALLLAGALAFAWWRFQQLRS